MLCCVRCMHLGIHVLPSDFAAHPTQPQQILWAKRVANSYTPSSGNPFRDTCVTEIFDRVPPGTIASFACSFSQKKRNRVHDVSVCVSSNIERISKYADAEQWGMYGTVLASVLRQEKLIFKNWRTTKPTNEHTPHHTTGRVLPYAIFRNRCEICDTPALNYILSDFIFVVGIERLVLNASMAANAEWYAAAAEA